MFTRTSKILLIAVLFLTGTAWAEESITIADFSGALNEGGVPAGWQLDKKYVMADLTIAKDDEISSSPQADTASPSAKWSFSITPYLWLPNVDGTLKYNIPPGAGGSPDVEVGPNEYLQNLQAVIMISGEAHRDRWSVFTDLIYLSFADQDSSVKTINFGGNLVSSSANVATSSTFRGIAWTLAAGYTVETGKAVMLDVIGGMRYFEISATSDWQLATSVTGPGGVQIFPRAGGVSESKNLLDGIVGVRGRVLLGNGKWSIPYYIDVGTGSSNLTWQWLLGVAYSFNWGGVTLAYRDLFYDQKDDKFLQDLRFSGPTLGVTFRF
ncbi:MAG TPA: hypothetical protein VEM40_08070 [Nitrospirota bacterium]|nr:hypothetical protein [Nitrospirota bacterium]